MFVGFIDHVGGHLGGGVMVKERPILFSGPMVKAILEGQKTMTRRAIKTPPEKIEVRSIYGVQGSDTVIKPILVNCDDGVWVKWNWSMTRLNNTVAMFNDSEWGCRCPYGQPGDRLWVRETWRPIGWHEGEPIFIEYQDSKKKECDSDLALPGTDYESWEEKVIEQASTECEKAGCKTTPEGSYFWEEGAKCPIKWRPSIHMPRWASRITLEVAEVRVERLQDITEEDAKAEGVETTLKPMSFTEERPLVVESYKYAFQLLWERINGTGTWDANPWVWVIGFKRIQP